jgi:hypothetical protein
LNYDVKKSPTDLARDMIFRERKKETKVHESRVSSTLVNEVNSFLEMGTYHSTHLGPSPILNYQLYNPNSLQPAKIDANTKINFIFIFANCPTNTGEFERVFTDITMHKINQICSNSQKPLVQVHAFCFGIGSERKKNLVLETITTETKGIFVFDFNETSQTEENFSHESINDFQVDNGIRISDIYSRIKDVYSNENDGILFGIFSNAIQKIIAEDEFILREFTNDCDYLSPIIVPTAHFPLEEHMYFELAGMIQVVVNLVSNSQDYRQSFLQAEKEIFTRCIEHYSHGASIGDEILASACSMFFASEKQGMNSFFTPHERNVEYGGNPTLIKDIDNTICSVQQKGHEFTSEHCKKLEQHIQNGIYCSLKSLNYLTETFPEYRQLLFAVVIATDTSIWANKRCSDLKNRENIFKTWEKFNSEDKPEIIGQQTYGHETTEGAIMTAFMLSIKSILEGRPTSSNLIYDLISKDEEKNGRSVKLRANDALDELHKKIAGKTLTDTPHGQTSIHPVNFILDSDIMKHLNTLYKECKKITHLDELLEQAPIRNSHEFLFTDCENKNKIGGERLKELCTNLKDAVSNKYPDGYSYGKTTPSYKAHDLRWHWR